MEDKTYMIPPFCSKSILRSTGEENTPKMDCSRLPLPESMNLQQFI
jgi:hypothetical protein